MMPGSPALMPMTSISAPTADRPRTFVAPCSVSPTAVASKLPSGPAGASVRPGPPTLLPRPRLGGGVAAVPARAPGVAPRKPAAPRNDESGKVPVDQNNAVVAFLREAGLQMYAASLLHSGFDDLETLAAIEDADMKDLGIPSYHVVRLRKKLQELQRRGADGEQELEAGHPVVAFLADLGFSQYARVLLKSGFDEMDTLLLADDLDLKELGVARGHALKLKRRLREFELEGAGQEDIALAPAPPVGRHQLSAPPRPQVPRGGATLSASGVSGRGVLSDQGRSAVEQSWEQVQAHGAHAVGEMLYRHTFTLAPEAIALFPPEVRHKYLEWDAEEADDEVWDSPALRKLFGKIVNAVGCTVAGLHDMDRIVSMLLKLGMRHISYGTAPPHWSVVGQALDLTLRDILGETYTQEIQQAWKTVYGFMSSIMIEGLRLAINERDAALSEVGPSTTTRSELDGPAISTVQSNRSFDDLRSTQCSSPVGARDVDSAIGGESKLVGLVQVAQEAQSVAVGSDSGPQ
mmetsp:Transcript_56623/g.172381  ORF Transcript_56623/g.172381 Transcript_56623/m.172381 type:complete len:519 (-) Transcript_56623:277-1833(-)